MKNVVLLGSTGSIGTSTIKVADDLPDQIRLIALAAGNNVDLLLEQTRKHKPQAISISDPAKAKGLSNILGKTTEVYAGNEGLIKLATMPAADIVLIAIVGTAGLQPARLVTATELQPETKPPDVTTLYHLKATAPADAIMMFRALVNDELSQAKDWHWALVAARGIPPAAPVSTPVPQNSLLQQSVITAPPTQEKAPGAQSQTPTPTSSAAQPLVDLPINTDHGFQVETYSVS